MKNNFTKKTFKPAEKMPISERAKQFMPFAALRGFEEAVALKEKEYFKEERSELSEEKKEEISRVISSLSEGDSVCVEYYDGYNYVTENFSETCADIKNGLLITNSVKISFCDIKNIYKL